jgi:head-tail adaptor
MYTSTLNKSIIIDKETTSKNSLRTPKETYSFLKEAYAGVWLKSGSTDYTQDGALPYTYVEFIIRYDERVDYKCRITYENQYYRINHIYVVGRKDWMRIQGVVFENE